MRQDRVKDRELDAHMLLCVDSQFKELVAGAAIAREAWVAIEQCFKGEARARKRETAAKWASITARNGEGAQRDGEKVYEYAKRVKGVAKDMERAGDKRDEGAVVDAFLQGLHGRHSTLKTVLEPQDGLTLVS